MTSPTSFQLGMALTIVGYPALAAAVGLVLARLLPAGSRLRAAALVLATAAGLLTSHVGLAGKPPWPPIDSIGWIPLVTAATALVLAVAALVLPRGGWRGAVPGRALVMALVALAAATALYYAGRPTFARSFDRYWVLAGFAVAGTVAAAGLLPAAGARSVRAAPWLAWIVVAAGLAGCTVWSHSALLAMLLGSAATTAGVVGLGSAVLRIEDDHGPAAGVFLVHLAATATYAHLYAKLPAWVLATAVLAALAPIAVPLALGRRRVIATLVGLLVSAGLIGLAAKRMHDADAASGKDAASMYM